MLVKKYEIGSNEIIQIGDTKIKLKKSGTKCVKVYIDAPKQLKIENFKEEKLNTKAG